jgi:hypothetical protein
MIVQLIYLLMILVLLGLAVWVVNEMFGPLPRPVMVALAVIALLCILLWLLGVVPLPRGRWGP